MRDVAGLPATKPSARAWRSPEPVNETARLPQFTPITRNLPHSADRKAHDQLPLFAIVIRWVVNAANPRERAVEISDYLENFAAWLFMAGWWLHAMEVDFVLQSLRAIDRNGGMPNRIDGESFGLEDDVESQKAAALAAMNDALTGRGFRPLAILGTRQWPARSETARLFRKALIEFGYHPDHGGSADMFRKAQEALDSVRKHASSMAR